LVSYFRIDSESRIGFGYIWFYVEEEFGTDYELKQLLVDSVLDPKFYTKFYS